MTDFFPEVAPIHYEGPDATSDLAYRVYDPDRVVQVNNATGPATFDPNDLTGACTDGTCVNSGSPNTDYTDHDLSRNDRGVSGGSFNYNNFWPILRFVYCATV